MLYRLLTLAGGVVAVAFAVGLFHVSAAADETSPGWLPPASLTLQKEAETSAIPPSLNGNIDCFREDSSNCVVNTPYGLANTNSGVKLNGTSSYTPVYSYIDGRQHFIAIPNSNTAISYTTEPPYGLYLYFNKDISRSITLSEAGTGQQYQINKPPDAILTDIDNHPLVADYNSISFSENGEWMIVSDPNVAMLRVNLETFEVTPFAPGFNYTIGLDPAPQTAISNDGRYAVVGSKDFDRFSIFDLDTCGQVPSTISEPVNCQSRDLQGFMSQQISGFINVSNLRFISEDTVGLYAAFNQGDSDLTAKFILSSGSGALHRLDYLALGDSYISGEGAFDYEPGTDTNDNTCHVSLVSYPYLLGHDLGYDSYQSAACSGATTDDILNTSGNYTGQAKPKTKRQDIGVRVDPILSDFEPGYIDQLDFVSTYQPKIITISIGGNDIGFSDKLRACLGEGTCYSSYEDRLEFVHEVNSKFSTLVDTYSKIKSAGAPDASIYVIGYPQIAKVGGDCALNVHMNNDELVFAQQAIDYLDRVIEAAAAKAGVAYVDTEDALDGHRLCEAKPGSVAVNGVTAGNDFPDILGGPIGRESYHPNDFGHELLEQTILTKTRDLTESMPAPSLSSAPPAEGGLEILDAPQTGRDVAMPEYDPSLSDDVLFKQSVNDLSVEGVDHSLAATTNFQVSLHSDPISLGSYLTDGTGNLSLHLAIPDSTPAGFHTLHLYGEDMTGQVIDIYKLVYVADSPTDWDGDGIPDNLDPCIGVLSSGYDTDQDGKDDSCDAVIGDTLAEDANTTSIDYAIDSHQATVYNSGSRTQIESNARSVLSAETAKAAVDHYVLRQPFGQANSPSPRFLAATAGIGFFLAASYAAWKFRP